MKNEKNKDEIKALKMDIKKAERNIKFQEITEQKEKNHEAVLAKWRERLPNMRLFFIRDENRFYDFGRDKWSTTITREALKLTYNIRGEEFYAFMDVMEELGRIKHSAEYSFYNDNNSNVLNMLNKDMWLKPISGKVHPIFTILLNSLSDERQQVREHLEQLVYWKYTHPEDYRLPAPVIYGEGGIGKNEFVLRVLKTLFNGAKVESLNSSMVMGDYSGLMLGNVVTLVNELQGVTKKEMARMKDLIGNQYISLNPKGKSQITIPATSMIITAGNDINGAILLDGGSSDKRWSPIRCRRNIVLHCMLYHGIDISEYLYMEKSEMMQKPLYKEYEKILVDWIPLLSESEEVATWLNYLCEKYVGMDSRPDCYHGEEYYELLSSQRVDVDDFCELIFNSPVFNNISNNMFYSCYKTYMRDEASDYKNKNKLGKKDLIAAAQEYITKHGLSVEHCDKNSNVKMYDKTVRKTFYGFKALILKEQPQIQDDKYLIIDSGDIILNYEWLNDVIDNTDIKADLIPIFDKL